MLEIDRRVDQPRGKLDAELSQPFALPLLRRRVIDLEDAKTSIHQIASAVGEGVETRAQHDVLTNARLHRVRDHVLGQASTYTHPTDEYRQARPLQSLDKPIAQFLAVNASEIERQVIVQHPRRRLLTMQCPGNSRQHRGTARTVDHRTSTTTHRLPDHERPSDR